MDNKIKIKSIPLTKIKEVDCQEQQNKTNDDLRDKIDEINKKEKVHLTLNEVEKLKRIGYGVSGEVYLAKHPDSSKLFALKVIPYKDDEKLKALVINEIKALHECRNNFIIKCYASYIQESSICILLEFMDRGTLADVVKKGKIPECILGLMTVQILKGLHFLHSLKIIHRDIKPSNILLNSKGLLKISDFGVSGYLKDSNDQRSTMVGTYMYMSPERISGQKYTAVSDIWSMAMTIFECAVGMNPLLYNKKGKNSNLQYWTLVEALKDSPPPELSVHEFSEELCDFMKLCLVKNPAERCSSQQLLSHKFITMYEKVPVFELANWLNNL